MEGFVDALGAAHPRAGRRRSACICALSGGVDSTVVAALVHRAIGDRLTCIFVDNGLLRAGEADAGRARLPRAHGARRPRASTPRRASSKNLARRRGPGAKRRIIGVTFIEVFEEEAAHAPATSTFLAQGTLYPDVIESVSVRGPSATIKSHHNVGGLPERMQLELLEPLRELFKDEVRELGRVLGVPEEIVWRQPFPGPGLAIRILGAGRRGAARASCAPPTRSCRRRSARADLYDSLWQAFAVLLPVQTVGVMGDERTYENVVAIRAVQLDRRHDGRLGAAPGRPAGAALDPHHQRGARASTASSTTSRRSRRRRSSGSRALGRATPLDPASPNMARKSN